jgi:hypothetical protein
VIVPTVDRGDCGPAVFWWIATAGAESRRSEVDVGLGELPEELPRVAGEGLDVAALALGEEGVERRGTGLAGPRTAR